MAVKEGEAATYNVSLSLMFDGPATCKELARRLPKNELNVDQTTSILSKEGLFGRRQNNEGRYVYYIAPFHITLAYHYGNMYLDKTGLDPLPQYATLWDIAFAFQCANRYFKGYYGGLT